MLQKTEGLRFQDEIQKVLQEKRDQVRKLEMLKQKVKRAQTEVMKSQGGCDDIHSETVKVET